MIIGALASLAAEANAPVIGVESARLHDVSYLVDERECLGAGADEAGSGPGTWSRADGNPVADLIRADASCPHRTSGDRVTIEFIREQHSAHGDIVLKQRGKF